MTPAEFKKKWSRFHGKETSGYVEHFNDLCQMLGFETPAEADPSGRDFFCFQKRVVKDAELNLEAMEPNISMSGERGFADVWKKGCFAFEYKGKKKDLDAAYKQLLRYRESLENPPLLVVCDFDRYIIKTNFNGTVQEKYEFTNDEIDRPEYLRVLRALFSDPEFLKPQRTTAEVTEKLAGKIAQVALSLQKRESVEIADASTRKQVHFAQRKNLRIARFLNRIVFCFFAEDSGLLPSNLFTEIARTGLEDSHQFATALESLFRVMATGGMFGHHKIRHFNGHLFEEATVFELNEDELRILAEAGEADWQFIQPSIMGTLFERALDENQRSQLGAHYTSENDIRTLVEPVLMSPLRREWSALKGELSPAFKSGRAGKGVREKIGAFLKKIAGTTVLDPACGSGNFLYVSLQLLLGLEKEVITFATQVGLEFKSLVNVRQLKAIEINPYAYELAQVSVQIGYLQWRRDNGFENERTPVLQVLDGFENKDALMHETFRKRPKNLKAAREEEHGGQDNLFKVYVERAWPECDVIVGNPPFLGDKVMRRELGHQYVEELRKMFSERLPGQADFCCYWFEKARELIGEGQCKRAGLLATQNIRGGASRRVLDNIKKSGDIFFAISDRNWVLSGAMVHISMVGFDDGTEMQRFLDGKAVTAINANLSASIDMTKAIPLVENRDVGFIGSCKGGAFDIDEGEALKLLRGSGNPNGLPNSDLVRPVANSRDLTADRIQRWIIDTKDFLLEEASKYVNPFTLVVERVKPVRDLNRDKWLKKNWWRPQRMRPEMRNAIEKIDRFIVSPTTSKHRIFVWLAHPILPDHKLVVIARADDSSFGILHSRFHEIWAQSIGTQLRERESGLNYNVESSLETFPFPHSTSVQEINVAAAAKELNDLRERWLNPPEWTHEQILEFPGSVGGPWCRFLQADTVNQETGIGIVRYARFEPRDSDCANKLKKRTLTNLYNERPTWLDLAHKKLDVAVARAYGWNDFANIIENAEVGQTFDFDRDTWITVDTTADGQRQAQEKFDKNFREKILERLLALNLERAAHESEDQKGEPKKSIKAQRQKLDDELV